MDEDCIFCKKVSGELPSDNIFENEDFLVFRDQNEVVKGHYLVIPKKHYATFLDIPSDIYSKFMEAIHEGIKKSLDEDGFVGYNLIMNNDKIAGQIIFHAHMHIIPRKEGDDLRTFVGGKRH